MTRRLLLKRTVLSAAAAWLLPAGRGALAQPRYAISAATLQDAVARRFPMRMRFGALLQLTVRTPVLQLLPEANRLGTEMVLVAAGPGLEQPATGEFDLDFALRYERSDKTLRARGLRVRSLRVSGLPEPYPELLDGIAPTLAQQVFGEIVLHRLRPADLALADGLGLEPDTVTVTADGLVIGFAPKLAR